MLRGMPPELAQPAKPYFGAGIAEAPCYSDQSWLSEPQQKPLCVRLERGIRTKEIGTWQGILPKNHGVFAKNARGDGAKHEEPCGHEKTTK